MPPEKSIVVVGSINMDLVARAPRMPAPGQTVLGNSFMTSPGGKGANQAVALARLGARCRFIGRVGTDAFGEQLLAAMKQEGIDCTDVMATPEAPTGVALIIVDAKGENSIVVAPGANHMVTPDDVFSREEAFKLAGVVLLQLELPLPTVRAAIDVARRNGCRIILDPAPAPATIPAELCRVDIITPNVTEAQVLTGRSATDERGDKLVASDLIERGAQCAVLKLGARGSLVVMADGHFYTVPPYKVEVVDTTAAGDAFTAALAMGVACGKSMRDAARFANAAGALACTKLGAQASMPTLDDVKAFMIRAAEMEEG
ncbi:MAG: ribokinase [Phycisphaerae bacterium]